MLDVKYFAYILKMNQIRLLAKPNPSPWTILEWQVATLIAVYANWGFARIEGCGWGWAGVIWLFSVVTYVPLDILKFAIRYILSGKAWDNLLENKVYFFITKSRVWVCFSASVSFLFAHSLSSCNRLPLLQRKTTAKKREKLSGPQHRGPSMAFNLLRPPTICFLKRIVTGSFLRSPSKPSGGLRWQGKQAVFVMFHIQWMGERKSSCFSTIFILMKDGFYRLRELNTLKGHVESVVKLKGLDIDTIQQHYTV